MGMMMHRNKKKKRVDEKSTLSFEPKEEKQEKVIPKPTKTDINRMPVDELRKMALNTGIENAESMTGTELKKHLIDILGL